MKKRLEIIRLRFVRSWKAMLLIALVGTSASVLAWKLDVLGIQGNEVGAFDDGLTAFTNKSWFPWGQNERSKDIVIVAIDDKTFDGIAQNESYRMNFGSFPYSRNLWAQIFTHLVEEGARMIVMDMVVDEPHSDPSGDLAMATVVGERKVPLYFGFNVLPKMKPLPKVEAKNRLPEVPVRTPPKPAEPSSEAGAEETFPGTEPARGEETFPSEETFPGTEKAKEDDGKLLFRAAMAMAFPVETAGDLELQPFSTVVVRDVSGKPTGEELPRHPKPPLEPLLDVTPGLGLVELEADDDGKMRRTRFAYTDGHNRYVTLPVAVVADWFKADKVVIEPNRLRLGSHEVPINADGSAEIHYGGELAERFESRSLINVIDDYALKQAGQKRHPLMQGIFEDKIVLIAGFAVGTADVKPTPFKSQEPGVVKHAAEIDNLLHKRFITEAPFWVSVALALVVAFVSVTLVTAVRSTVVDIGWPVALQFGFFAVTGIFLVVTQVHVNSTMPMLAGELASIATTAFHRFLGEKEREKLRDLFKSYMEPHLVDMLVEQRKLPQLHGEHREVTAYFSDIKGFSSISEQLKEEPQKLVALLNRYFNTVTPVLKHHGACIDKYIGDAVVAIFGAPMDQPAHAVAACRAALAVQRAVAALNEKLKAEGLPEVATRIGLNTDTMLVANVGSDDLLDYTAIGDGMNLASRLEGTNKAYDTRVLIGPSTFEMAREHIEAARSTGCAWPAAARSSPSTSCSRSGAS